MNKRALEQATPDKTKYSSLKPLQTCINIEVREVTPKHSTDDSLTWKKHSTQLIENSYTGPC